MYFADLSPRFEDPSVVTVGWLEPPHQYTSGSVDPATLQILKTLPTTAQTRGFHRCPYCSNATSSNEIHVNYNGKLYTSPRMIIHYIEEHGYRPPDEYLDAVNNSHNTTNQAIDSVYESVVHKITHGTVTVDDINRLIEATDKSARERIHRRTRNSATSGIATRDNTNSSMVGRIVPKKTGRNDPPRQGRGRRYASGTPAKERQNAEQRRRAANEGSHILTNIHRLLDGGDEVIRGIPVEEAIECRAVVSAMLRSRTSVPQPLVESIGGQRGLDDALDALYDALPALDDYIRDSGRSIPAARMVVERSGRGTQEKGSTRQDNKNSGKNSGKSMGKKGKKEESRKYTVTGKPEQLNVLEQLFAWIQHCGSVGHSGAMELFVDGDGSARLKFDGVNIEAPETSQSDPELKLGID